MCVCVTVVYLKPRLQQFFMCTINGKTFHVFKCSGRAIKKCEIEFTATVAAAAMAAVVAAATTVRSFTFDFTNLHAMRIAHVNKCQHFVIGQLIYFGLITSKYHIMRYFYYILYRFYV